jgi:CubicO group peptidase (beta-lactamase class C family)
MARLLTSLLVVLSLSLIAAPAHGAAASPATDWATATPEQAGFDAAQLADGLLAIRASGAPIHSLLLIRHGRLVLDATFYPYDGATPHDVASVTKTVTTTLVGIAADQGKLRLDAPVLSFFPNRTHSHRDARKERITVADLASMTSGLACTAANGEPTLREMTESADWVQFALDLPMAADPGATFAYCSPATHVLSAILTQATGMSELDFAKQVLFGPLGITDVVWPADPQGITHGWGDLCLEARDLAKLGQLWLNGGRWNGKQVVSRAWVEAATEVHATTGGDEDYGFGWWIDRQSDVGGEYAAEGRGGQWVRVFPALDAVVVTTAGGIEPSQALAQIAKAMGDPAKPLPANPAGDARLREVLGQLVAPPTARPVPPLPATARAISGRTYAFAANALDLATLRLDFDGSPEARIAASFTDGREPLTAAIGLDGVYRMHPDRNGFPAGLQATWTEATTFVLEYDEIANIDNYVLTMHFQDGAVAIDVEDPTHDATAQVEGRAG